jgi:two-component system, NarL family, invasion response regulator UvrY
MPQQSSLTLLSHTLAVESREMPRILIADDHPVVRRGLRELLADAFPGSSFGEAGDVAGTIEHLGKPWDLALVDITMPGKSGLELLKHIKQAAPNLPVLILSAHPEDQFAVRMLKAGASGYVTKQTAPEELVRAVRKVLAGRRYVSPALAEKLAVALEKDPTRAPHEALSDREYEVMRMIALGKTVTEISKELDLSVKTVSTYRARILEKMEMKNSAEITRYAIRNNLVD